MSQPLSSTDGAEDSLFGKVASEFSERLACGESPGIDDYVARYPQIAAWIRDVFPALQALQSRGASSQDSQSRHKQWTQLKQHERLGDFLILREIGRGGMGIVYEALQLSMGRRVALKILPYAALADDRQLQRFQNEIRAVATLSHPNIVSIYSVGEEQGVHYYAMQLIRGHSLADVIGRLRRSTQEADRSLDEHSLTDSLASLPGVDDGDPAALPRSDECASGCDHADRVPGPTPESVAVFARFGKAGAGLHPVRSPNDRGRRRCSGTRAPTGNRAS